MPPRLLRLALLLPAVLVAAGGSGACFSPILTAKPADAGFDRSDAADTGPSNLDGSCPLCLNACLPTCEAGDAGCPFASSTALTAGCAPSSYSLAIALSAPEAGDAGDAGSGETDAGAPVEIGRGVSFCACDETWIASGAVGGALETAKVFSSCGRSVVRFPHGSTDPRILLDDPTGTVRLFTRNLNGTWSFDEPPFVRAPATLVLDADGQPHLAGMGQGAIVYVRKVDGQWVPDSAANADLDSRGLILLALGPDGLPRIAFSEGDVQLATLTPKGWVHSTASFKGQPLSLQVDASGRAHLLYLQDGVRYAMQMPGGGWVAELVDGKATAGALRLTDEGCPRAAWSADGIYFGERTLDGWKAQRVSDGTFGVMDEPFELLPGGRPLVLHGAATLEFSGR